MRLALAVALLLSTTPAFALDAVTYSGTLGGYPIIAELSDPAAGTVVGRYSYMSKGGDIPLDAMAQADGVIAMAEEAPCTEQTCIENDQGIIDPPIGAIWNLQFSAADQTLTGQWQASGKAGKPLPIVLNEIGRRTLADDVEVTPYSGDTLVDGFEVTPYSLYSGWDIASTGTVYDVAKMDVSFEEGSVQTIGGSTIRFLTDPRSKFAFPRIVALADGSSPDAANAVLAAEHQAISSYAFECLAGVYAGFGGNQYAAVGGAGTLGGFEDELVSVPYLSPTVMNWIESGSTWCGGAYPNNHSDSHIIDVKTGAPLALAKVFKDWVPVNNTNNYDAQVDQAAALAAPQDYYWQAGQPLIDYAIANRVHSDDAEFEDQCGIDELITTNLGLQFAGDDTVVFTLQGLPHVIFACSDDLLTVPLADIPQLLAPTASDYFPALAN